MRKILYSLFVLTLISGPLLAQDTRVVYSETFETADDVSEWGVFVGGTGFTAPTQNATAGVGSTGALELTDGGFAFLIERPITATVGEEYSLTFDVKTLAWDNTRTLNVSVIGIDSLPKSVNVSNITEFTTITLGGIVTNASGHIQISGGNGGGENKVWLDNISFIVNQPFSLSTYFEESFETADDVSNWSEYVGADGFTEPSQNATAGVSGTGALEFTDGGFAFLIERPITATVGTEYSLTFDVKTLAWDNTRTLNVSVIGIDAHPKSVNVSNITEFTTIRLGGYSYECKRSYPIIGR